MHVDIVTLHRLAGALNARREIVDLEGCGDKGGEGQSGREEGGEELHFCEVVSLAKESPGLGEVIQCSGRILKSHGGEE